ncbi:cytochrome P450 4d2-like isoform X2 [Hermetia illucens]|uniref:cytochrome P450 4d2-like isoform X2 n=1 Tax=Hermetia illucens TaxID=343691 RepID=UPI0018CC5103|nr:cytochrome P450 4d2-like isoform X2 [Hermetia illucens]
MQASLLDARKPLTMYFILLLVIITFLLVDFLAKIRRYSLTSNYPGPKIYPIFGTTEIFKRRKAEEYLEVFRGYSVKYGPIYRMWIGHELIIFIEDPAILETLLSSPKYINKHSIYGMVKFWLRDGLLLSTGPKWHSRRKIAAAAFHYKILEGFVDVFDRNSHILAKKFKKHLDGNEFDIYWDVSLAALDIICESAMGTKIDAQTSTDCEYIPAVEELSNILCQRVTNVCYWNEGIFGILAPKIKARQDHLVKILHNFTEDVILKRRDALLTNQIKGDGISPPESKRKRAALLDVLLQSTIDGKPLTNADIQEEVDTFMFGGHDTSASAVSFALYRLSRHPEVQSRAFQEICEVIGTDKNKPVTYKDLQSLKYLECVIKETLRLYPSISLLGRRALEDSKIDEYWIPANSNIIVPCHIVLRNPSSFPDPDKFNPDRFLENSAEINPYSFIPFSAGPRQCVGQRYAMLEMKSLLSTMLRYYELLPMGPDPLPIAYLVLKSTNGVHIGIRERKF